MPPLHNLSILLLHLLPLLLTNALPSLPLSTCTRVWSTGYDYSLIINSKTTPETGALGSGLHDNLNGLCGKQALGWGQPMPIPGGYHVEFNVDGGAEGCVESAVWVAEGKNVTCFTR